MNIKELKEYIKDLPDDMEILKQEWLWDWVWWTWYYEEISPEIRTHKNNTKFIYV